LVVLQSFPEPLPSTNPYVIQLQHALDDTGQARVVTFAWRTALFGRYDVFHAHWPETLLEGRTRLRGLVRQALFAVILLRLRGQRIPLVRTVHNIDLPEGISRRETALLRWADRWTNLRIVLNVHTPLPPDEPWALIPHGHYRDWFARFPKPDSVPGRVGFFGLVRRYKAVDTLIRAFRDTAENGADLSLRVAGRPSASQLVDQLIELAGDDDRITFAFGFLTDEQIVEEVGAAQLVVLPYPKMHNSGGTLTALSLGRPVLIPDNDVNRDLRDEVGPAWVSLFDGELGSADILRAMAATDRTDRTAPDLSRREWAPAARDHLAAYRRAVALLHRGR
jgi:glycosyltransferase involved in cell wall biosynthesis